MNHLKSYCKNSFGSHDESVSKWSTILNLGNKPVASKNKWQTLRHIITNVYYLTASVYYSHTRGSSSWPAMLLQYPRHYTNTTWRSLLKLKICLAHSAKLPNGLYLAERAAERAIYFKRCMKAKHKTARFQHLLAYITSKQWVILCMT